MLLNQFKTSCVFRQMLIFVAAIVLWSIFSTIFLLTIPSSLFVVLISLQFGLWSLSVIKASRWAIVSILSSRSSFFGYCRCFFVYCCNLAMCRILVDFLDILVEDGFVVFRRHLVILVIWSYFPLIHVLTITAPDIS